MEGEWQEKGWWRKGGRTRELRAESRVGRRRTRRRRNEGDKVGGRRKARGKGREKSRKSKKKGEIGKSMGRWVRTGEKRMGKKMKVGTGVVKGESKKE